MSRFIDYMRRRKQRFTHKASIILAKSHQSGDKAAFIAVLIFFLWIGLDSINTYFDSKHIETCRAEEIDKLEKIIVACLNKKPINVSGIAFECKAESLGLKL